MTTVRKRLAPIAILALLGSGCSADTEPTDLRTLARTSSPNDALACPPATCAANTDLESPHFDLRAEQLEDIVRRVVSAQARTELAQEDPEIGQLVFVQRSRIFGFADTIWIQTVDQESQASLIIYSRSNLGFWDLGVNRRRVRSWLSEIETAAQSASKDSANKVADEGTAREVGQLDGMQKRLICKVTALPFKS